MSCKEFKSDFKPDFARQRIDKKAKKLEDKKTASRKHNAFYKMLWQKVPHYCYECGVTLKFFDKSLCHHILPKRFQKKYSIDLDNIDNGVLLCLDCHDQVELNIAKVPRVKKLTELQYKAYEQFLLTP
jgi:hypothetical protein